MATTASMSSSAPKRQTFACIRCAERKVKCDRQRPCSACIKHQVECVFNPVQQPRKRNRRVKVHVLADKIKQYEALLREQGIDPGRLPDASPPGTHRESRQDVQTEQQLFHLPTPASLDAGPQRYSGGTPSIREQEPFSFVENSLWTRVVEESRDSESSESSGLDSTDDCNIVFGSQRRMSRQHRHPPPEYIHQLWELFVDNVDPLTKAVHVPTLRPAIRKAASNIKAIPRAFEALMFAIYSTAAMSLTDEDCQQRFSEPQKAMHLRYILATEAALSRANVMTTVDLVVLQALVLHLISVRDVYEPRANWTLTGVAIRIAQVMGLERDGSVLRLPPFETEMRRRVWWLLKLHDFRTAELCGLAKFRDLEVGGDRTRWPSNVDDDQLYLGVPEIVDETGKMTDVAFVAVRCDMADFAANQVAKFRQQGIDPSNWNLDKSASKKAEVESTVNALIDDMERRHLRYCDPSQPVHLVTMLVARYGMNVIRFLSNHPRRWASLEQTPIEERNTIWAVGLKLLEQHNMVKSNTLLKGFAWNAAYFRQWHAFIHVLDVLRQNPLKADADKAWQLVGGAYDNTPDMLTNMKKPIHAAVGNLCLKAYHERENALKAENGYMPPTPKFITELRQLREAARARKQARNAKSSQAAELPSQDPTSTDFGQLELRPSVAGDGTAGSGSYDTTKNELGANQFDFNDQTNGFNFFNDFDNGQYGSLDMELDHLLAQDHVMGGMETVSWEQWDAWLAESNVMRT